MAAPVFIQTAPQQESRLEAGGWFARAFGSTLGIIFALLAIPATLFVILCGGCLFIGGAGTAAVGTVGAEAARRRAEQAEDAAKRALPELKKFDIVDFRDDLSFVESASGRKVAGRGTNAEGELVDVVVTCDVGLTIGNTPLWRVDEIRIGPDTVFERE